MSKDEIIHIIQELDPYEADAMGASCQMFAAELVKKINEFKDVHDTQRKSKR